MTTNAFLLSWDHYGLEACVPITQYENPDWLFDALATGKIPANPLGGILHAIKLRARFNAHRHYEVYAVDFADTEMDEDGVRAMFDANPQGMAELVRRSGVCLHNDRAQSVKIKIT